MLYSTLLSKIKNLNKYFEDYDKQKILSDEVKVGEGELLVKFINFRNLCAKEQGEPSYVKFY